jgi:hypothetical protein
MIILIPVGLLLLGAIIILVLDRIRPKFGTSWLIAASVSIIAWFIIFFFRLRLPTLIQVFSWQPSELHLFGHFSLIMEYDNWPYLLSLITICLAVIFSDAARTRYEMTPQSWAASLVITSFGLLAILAGTSLSLMMTWIIVDVYELVYLLGLKEEGQSLPNIIQSFIVRIASILVLVFATLQGWREVGSFDLTQIPQNASFFFLLAAGLRLGAFPLNLPFLQEPSLRRGVGSIIRLAPVAASLSLLSRLPTEVLPAQLLAWKPLFMGLLSAAALYAAVRWLLASDEIEGRPFWIIAWASMATASVINGAPTASLAWGIALLLPGSLLFLNFPRIQRMNFLLYFGLIGIIGLPLTPAASGWAGFVSNGVTVWTFLFILTHAIMVLGYLERVMQAGGEAGALESWARLVFPLSLIIIIQAVIALGLVGWPGSLTSGVWWLGLVSIFILTAAFYLIRRLGLTPPYLKITSSSKSGNALNHILPLFEKFFRFGWLYQLLWLLFRFVERILKGFSMILESQGGVLWTILLLVLLISVLLGGG